MSFLSGIGKFIGKVAKVALPIVKFGSSFIPGVGGVVSKVLTSGFGKKASGIAQRVQAGQKVLKMSGSPFATAGPATAAVGASLLAVKHARTSHKVASILKRRKTTKRRTVKRATAKRSPTKRRKAKLKFGSPAWRKKYVKKRR